MKDRVLRENFGYNQWGFRQGLRSKVQSCQQCEQSLEQLWVVLTEASVFNPSKPGNDRRFQMGRLKTMALLFIIRYSTDPVYYKTWSMNSYVSDNVHLPYQPTSRDGSSRWEFCLVISHLWIVVAGGSHINCRGTPFYTVPFLAKEAHLHLLRTTAHGTWQW